MSLDVSGSVGKVLSTALDGISLRQRVIADNIANVDTPGFRASSVDFETSLRRAVEDGAASTGDLSGVEVEAQATGTPVGANGNNVDLRKETLAAVQSQYQYQVVSRAVTDRFTLMRDSIGTA